jgi:gamma-butyrobetaine dioxygenase/trimethyllysine dioxygenase
LGRKHRNGVTFFCFVRFHKQTNKRIQNVASASISTAGTHLHVVWKDSSTASEFSLQELQAHNYGPNRAGVDPIETPLPAIEVSAAANWRHTLQQHGAVVVRGYGLDTEKLIGDFESLGLSLWESHFGRIEDLRTDNTTNKNTDQLGLARARELCRLCHKEITRVVW